MTWRAQAGKLVLAGSEAKLFCEALRSLCDAILEAEDDEESSFERAAVFDRMSRSQQLASLETVARYLLHPTPECLPLTAWSEATLATVIDEVKRCVRDALEEGDPEGYRQTVIDALAIDDWDDPEEWEDVLDCYDERFLWDSDFEDEGGMDLPPEQEAGARTTLGITDDYYTAVPPDLSASETMQDGADRVLIALPDGLR